MQISPNEVKEHIKNLAKITEPNRPYTRQVFSPLYSKGREYIKNHFANLGLELMYDDFANIFAIKKGSCNECVIIGSHSDTVASGGRFDGILGVVAAMIIASKLKDIKLSKSLIFCDYFGEEPNEYGLSCVGSRGLSGYLSTKQLELKINGISLAEQIIKAGGSSSFRGFNELNIGKLIASYELHIEQGNTLESLNKKIAIVSSIVGIARFNIDFLGLSNHAGTTAMNLRSDALVNAAKFISWLNETAINYNKKAYTVATVGRCEVLPNAANVIANKVSLSVDLRSESDEIRLDFIEKIKNFSKELNANASLIADSNATPANELIMKELKKSADLLNIDAISIPSGAGHDSAFLAKLAPMGMLFVPSCNGLSHHPDEFSDYCECAAGIEILLNTIIRNYQ